MLIYIIILLSSTEGIILVFQNMIHCISVQPEVSGTEGDNITLSCNYSSAVSLQWYRQYPNSAPEFLLIILHSSGKVSQKSKIVEQDPRFAGKLNEKKTHVDLEISSVKVTDSAMYYCALTPTVTGKQTTLYKNLTYVNYPVKRVT
uniref:T-cell receptor alpha/delta variable 25.0.4 n=1 Tax=Cyprinus carpio TaxID=7962 RepID=A0A8C1QFX9_CYPCA